MIASLVLAAYLVLKRSPLSITLIHHYYHQLESSFHKLVKPIDGLQESLLHGEFYHPVRDIGTNGVAVLDPRVEIDLVGSPNLNQDILAFAALGSGEDGVSLCVKDPLSASSRGVTQCLMYHIPAAAILSGPSIPRSSSTSTSDG